MPEVFAPDGTRLHTVVDGEGEPVTVFAHGLTNSCYELAAFTPMLPGTKVRFCFRGHAHSGTPEPGHYRFADFASDVEAVSTAYGATRAVGTSLGAGAITHLLGDDPDRFERIVFLLPAALDVALGESGRFDDVADLLETLAARRGDRSHRGRIRPRDRVRREALAPRARHVPVAGPQRGRRRARDPRRDARRRDQRSRAAARGHRAHDDHLPGRRRAAPVELGRILADIMPNSELVVIGSEGEMMARLPELVAKVAVFLAADG